MTEPGHSGENSSPLYARAIGTGCLLWLVALIVTTLLNSARLGRVLFPLMEPIGALAPPGVNIGTAERPILEETPVQMAASFAGIALSAVVYVFAVYVLLLWWQRHSRATPSDNG